MKRAGASAGGLFHGDYLETLAEAYRQAGRFDEGVAQLPVLIATADPTSGFAPLLVNFDASQSYDPDGDTFDPV